MLITQINVLLLICILPQDSVISPLCCLYPLFHTLLASPHFSSSQSSLSLEIPPTLSCLATGHTALSSTNHSCTISSQSINKYPTTRRCCLLEGMSLRDIISAKRHHDQGNSYKEKHLVEAGLQFQRFSPLLSWQETW